MRDTRLIFVEGVLGAGKSTTVTRIAERLAEHGNVPLIVREGDARLRVGMQLAHGYAPWEDVSIGEFIGRCEDSWKAFVASLAPAAVAVSDGLLFHGNMTDLVLMGADAATPSAYFDRVLAELRPLRPSLVYLRVRDVRRTMRGICDQRGAAWEARQISWKLGSPPARSRGLEGFDGLVSLYEHFAGISDELVRRDAIPTLQLSDETPWPERERAVFDWLGAG